MNALDLVTYAVGIVAALFFAMILVAALVGGILGVVSVIRGE